MGKIIDGMVISDEIKNEIKQSIKFEMIKPSIAVIQVGDNKTSDSFIKQQQKACDEVGIYFRHYKYDSNASELTIINRIKELNNDEYINGIVLALPLPDGYNEKRIINTIANSKDVDGLTDINCGRLSSGRKTLVSSTALAVMEILHRNDINLEGKNVVLVGMASPAFKSLLHLFFNEGATVTICTEKTKDITTFINMADIIVSGVNIKDIINLDALKKDALLIDLDFNLDDNKSNNDIDYSKVLKNAEIVKTPGGIGPIIIAMLLKNAIYCYQNKKK